MRRHELLGKISSEIDRAYKLHGRRKWGRHEFYGILKEEVDELWATIKGDESQERLLEELIQVAAVCIRYAERGDRVRSPITRGNLTLA